MPNKFLKRPRLSLVLALAALVSAPAAYAGNAPGLSAPHQEVAGAFRSQDHYSPCLLYTSDAADDASSV